MILEEYSPEDENADPVDPAHADDLSPEAELKMLRSMAGGFKLAQKIITDELQESRRYPHPYIYIYIYVETCR